MFIIKITHVEIGGDLSLIFIPSRAMQAATIHRPRRRRVDRSSVGTNPSFSYAFIYLFVLFSFILPTFM
jgi:hypothetical protein